MMDERKKAKHRALYLLERIDRTEHELRQKLAQDYEPEVVEEALEYVKKYHYIDDMRYARNYIISKSQVKSRRQIEQELILKKGLSREFVDEAFSQVDVEDEVFLIRRWMEKKKIDPRTADRETLQKFYLFLMRRGFRSEDVRKTLFFASDEWE